MNGDLDACQQQLGNILKNNKDNEQATLVSITSSAYLTFTQTISYYRRSSYASCTMIHVTGSVIF